MSKHIANPSLWLAACLLLCVPLASAQQRTDLCERQGTVVGFFNGVLTTRDQADSALAELARTLGTTTPDGKAIRYEVFYNYTAGFDDFVETFAQRMHEHERLLQGRFELFFEALRGGGPGWSALVEAAPEAQVVLDTLVDASQAQAIASLTSLAGNPPTSVNYAEHRSRIDGLALEGQQLLFVAHSQGNLFVNAAFDYARGLVPQESIRVVHVAPASPSLRGLHVLANLDLVINGLRALGEVATVTNDIPGYLVRPPGTNGQRDVLGHGFIEIYMNPALDISHAVRGELQRVLNALVAPPATADVGFFTATLTWDGPGDADLHVLEPDATQVFYGNPEGTSGELDVDNVVGLGPEHYFATCDPSRLLLGTYRVALANYQGAEGRTATVQVASSMDGVLGTRSVVLGAATESRPSVLLFDLDVVSEADNVRVKVAN